MKLQPAPKSMTDLERQLVDLPVLPAVVSEGLTLDPMAEDYFARLPHLAERDPPFAVRVLRCANSASSAPLSPTDRCAGLLLALAVVNVFIPRSEAQRALWIRALQTGLFARMFCKSVALCNLRERQPT